MRCKRFNVLLALGSNIGEKKGNILLAYKYISNLKNTTVYKKSSFYETKPMGPKNQSSFINSTMLIKTKIKPFQLLNEIKKIEEKIGRIDSYRWGPRKIDIDIVCFNNLQINRKELNIPHIDYKNRDFVLIPGIEIIKNNENIPNKKKFLLYYNRILKRNNEKYVSKKYDI